MILPHDDQLAGAIINKGQLRLHTRCAHQRDTVEDARKAYGLHHPTRTLHILLCARLHSNQAKIGDVLHRYMDDAAWSTLEEVVWRHNEQIAPRESQPVNVASHERKSTKRHDSEQG